MRVIQDFSLQLMAEMLEQQASDDLLVPSLDETAAQKAKEAVNKDGGENSRSDSPDVANDGKVLDTVPKVKLKYKDRDGDYVTVLDRTEMSEIIEHAVSFHVYMLQVIKTDSRKKTMEGLLDMVTI